MRPEPATSFEEYLSRVESDSHRAELERLRAIIKDVVPDAKEGISYGIPTYKFNKTMVSIAAFKNHCSIFPGHTVQEFLDELKVFKTSTGTIQFSPEAPIPDDLVRRILRARFWPPQ